MQIPTDTYLYITDKVLITASIHTAHVGVHGNLNLLFGAQTECVVPPGETNNLYHHPVQTSTV